MTTISRPGSKPRSTERAAGHWIPWVFVGLFGIVLAVNGTMIAVAISTFTGMETTSAYKKGIDYNERLAAAAKQEALGWQASLGALPDGEGKVLLTFDLDDKTGAPVAAANVSAKVDRPLQDDLDQMVTLNEIRSGHYEASVDLPLKGQWEVQLTAQARGQRYQLTERIQVPR